MQDITNEAKPILKTMYCEYKARRKKAIPIETAKRFESADQLHRDFFPDLSPKDISSLCWELENVGFLKCVSSDFAVHRVFLTDEGISYLESLSKEKWEKFFGLLGKALGTIKMP